MKRNQKRIATFARLHGMDEEHAASLLYPEKDPILTRHIDDRWLLLGYIVLPALAGIIKLIWG